MKLEYKGHQGDVQIFEVVSELPDGKRFQDELTKNNQLALGELSGHNHYFDDSSAVDLYKVEGYDQFTFIETKKDATLIHGLIKGFKGKEADKDYHNEIVLPGNRKYVTSIVEETDWITGQIRRVID